MPKPRTKVEDVDRRVRRSKRQLHESLISLILERGWDEVSIQDICSRADVGRSTFYTHFADKEELLLTGLDDLHQALDLQSAGNKGSFAFAEGVVEHAKDKARLLRALIGKRSGATIQRQFREVMMQLVSAELVDLQLEPKQRQALIHYIGGAFVELLTSWLDRPSSIDPSTLAETFRTLTLGALAAYTSKPTA